MMRSRHQKHKPMTSFVYLLPTSILVIAFLWSRGCESVFVFKNQQQTEPPTIQLPRTCPVDYIFVDEEGVLFKKVTDRKVSYREARDLCRSDGQNYFIPNPDISGSKTGRNLLKAGVLPSTDSEEVGRNYIGLWTTVLFQNAKKDFWHPYEKRTVNIPTAKVLNAENGINYGLILKWDNDFLQRKYMTFDMESLALYTCVCFPPTALPATTNAMAINVPPPTKELLDQAYVTLATNDKYALGALVLAHSLRKVQTTRQLCILITPGISENIRFLLYNTFNSVVNVDVMDSNDSAHLTQLKRPELGVTFTKLHCWTLTQYKKCVFLDADILAVQNADELFDQPELSAVCDVGWPDCFNSGMFVFTPSQDTYSRLLQHAETNGSFDGGDQGILNTFFTNWNRLSFVYNTVASVPYLPAYKQYGKDVKLVHFLGATKPWHQARHYLKRIAITQQEQESLPIHLNTWWKIFFTSVRPRLPKKFKICL